MSLTTVDGSLISSGAITLTTQVTGTLPVANGGTGVTTSTGSGAVVLGTSPSISGAVMSTMASSVLTSATAQASTSGTSIDFTGIPSWVKRITVMFNGVSTNAATAIVAQIGGASIETSGYLGAVVYAGASTGAVVATTYFLLNPSGSAVELSYGNVLTLCLLDSATNTWSASNSGVFNQSGGWYSQAGGGTKSITGSLQKLRITSSTGTATFDAGSINILYE